MAPKVPENSTSKVPQMGKEVIYQPRLCDMENGLKPSVLDKVKLEKN